MLTFSFKVGNYKNRSEKDNTMCEPKGITLQDVLNNLETTILKSITPNQRQKPKDSCCQCCEDCLDKDFNNEELGE